MTKLNESSAQLNYYFPHHPVIRELSLTTKLRVVFDGSAKTDKGVSLNDLQLVGPTVQDDLLSIVIRFRKHPIVITADITKMYRQILIDESQRDLQRILWRENPTDSIECYHLNTVTYGTASAPYLATRCLLQLSIENQSAYPKASLAIKQDFYVGDLLTGASTIDEALTLQKDIDGILQSAQFQLRKWSSNNKTILETISTESKPSIIHVCEHPELKTLGIKWNSHHDTFQYSVKNVNINQSVTKRKILSTIAQIYNPLGLIGPITIIAKIIMQRLWKMKISWDESIQGTLHSEWQQFQSQLHLINQLEIPRHAICLDPIKLELHGFCDSSESAYGACVFIRSVNTSSPLKNTTLPRLELCSAVLLAQLAIRIREAIQLNFDNCYYWCDSTIVLHWINAPSYRWKTFVANRVSEIQNLTQIEQWRHISSAENSADLISRGVSPEKLIHSTLWKNGPNFLTEDKQKWPQTIFTNENNSSDCELQIEERSLHTTVTENYLFTKFSSLNKIQNVMAYVLRFISNTRIKEKENRYGGILKNTELHKALLHLIKLSQYESLKQDLRDLQNKSVVHLKSSLIKLSPFLDNNGLIRVGGRLQNSLYDYDKKHPILLPSKHKLTKLILQSEHIKLMHCGAQMLLNSVRQRFWPLAGRTLSRKIVHDCIICFKSSPKGQNPIMGDLPQTRITQAPPFYNTGVDYAGPFLLRDKRSRGFKIIKSYICLFICFTTKAIHLEAVSDLTSDTFIAALRRFCSRRGRPLNIYSDNATNFVKANSDLTELATFLSNEQVQNQINSYLTKEGVQWHFIPPRSPHFGGLWEAGVKSVKQHLVRVFKEA